LFPYVHEITDECDPSFYTLAPLYTAPVQAPRFEFDPILLAPGLFLFDHLQDVRTFLTENYLQGLGLAIVPAEVIETLNWEEPRRTPAVVAVPASPEVAQIFFDLRSVLTELIAWNLRTQT
jgi:hypothetical protein